MKSKHNASSLSSGGRSGVKGGGGGAHHHLLDHEETFLLVKPDASEHHTTILQAISDLGLQITMRSFVVTREQAATIVNLYPGIVASAELLRFSGLLQGKYGGGSITSSSAVGGAVTSALFTANTLLGDGAGGTISPVDDERPDNGSPTSRTPGGTSAMGSMLMDRLSHRVRRATDQHNSITAEIMRLAKKGAEDSRSGVNAGLAGDDTDVASVTSLPVRVNSPTTLSESSEAAASSRRVTTTTRKSSLKSTEEQARDHLQHLVSGGTCLAMVVAGPNAVSTLLALAGPEDPSDARATAPKSLRAKLGKDAVRNAVFAASSVRDASTLIRCVFGVDAHLSEGRRKAVDVAAVHQATSSGGNGVTGASTAAGDDGASWMGSFYARGIMERKVGAEQFPTARNRPPNDLLRIDGVGDMEFEVDADQEGKPEAFLGGLFDGEGGGLQRRQYPMGARPLAGRREVDTSVDKDESRGSGAGGDGIGGGAGSAGADGRNAEGSTNNSGVRPGGGGGGGGGATAELARMLGEERKRLLQQSKALRLREMDLILREQEIFRIAASTTSSTTSPKAGAGGVASAVGNSSAASFIHSGIMSKSGSLSEESLPLRTPRPPQRTVGGPLRIAVGPTSPLEAGLGAGSGSGGGGISIPSGPLVREEDIDGLIRNPRRVGYLFTRLDKNATGYLTHDDFLQLYMRSPCLHLVGREDHAAEVLTMLRRQSPPEMNVEHFTLALMRLLRM